MKEQPSQASVSHIQIELNEAQQEIKTAHLNAYASLRLHQSPDTQYKTPLSYKEFIQRDKIDQDTKLLMQRHNLLLLRKDPGKERKQYYLSIMGLDFVEEHTLDFKHLMKNKDYLEHKIFALQLAYNDLALLHKNAQENNQIGFDLAFDVLKCLIKHNYYYNYHVVWAVCVYNFLKQFPNEQCLAFLLTQWVIDKVYPPDYFSYLYRFGARQSYVRVLALQLQKSHPAYYEFFTQKMLRKGVPYDNHEALFDNIERQQAQMMDRLFFFHRQTHKNFIRLFDYIILFPSDLILKMSYKAMVSQVSSVMSQVKDYLPIKNRNIQDIIFANRQVEFDPRDVPFLEIAQEIVKDYTLPPAKRKYKSYDDYFKEALEQAFNNEFQTAYFIRNERVAQARRAMGIMTLRKTEINDAKIDYFMDALTKSKKDLFTYKDLNKIFKTSSAVSPIKKDFISTLVSLSTSQSLSLQTIELKFLLTLISNYPPEEKLVKLFLLFLTEEEYSKVQVEYQLCRLENYLDPRLALFNKGSTLMHTMPETVSKNKLIQLLLKTPQTRYLFQTINNFTCRDQIDEDSVLLHYQDHEAYVNQQAIQQQLEEREAQQLREEIIKERKQEEIDQKQDDINKLQFVNVIPEDENDLEEELNEEGLDVAGMNAYWDKQYEEFRKKQSNRERKETNLSLFKISMGDVQADQVKNVSKNIHLVNDSLLTIAEDHQEKFTTEYFNDLAKKKIVPHLSKVGNWFNFSQNTLNIDTLYDSEGMAKMTVDPMSRQHDLNQLQATAERYLDDELQRTQVTQKYLQDVYQTIYIGAMVQVVEKRELDDQKKSVQIENAFEELDIMQNGPVDGRNKDTSMQVIYEELLDEDAIEQARIQAEVDARYAKLKKKQVRIQQQNVVIFQSKIQEIQTKYKEKDDKRIQLLGDRVTRKLHSEQTRMAEAISIAQEETNRATAELAAIKAGMVIMEGDKDNFIKMQQQQQEQLLVHQQQQEKLIQENLKQEQQMIEQANKERALEEELKAKEAQLLEQQEKLKEQEEINRKKQEELDQILTVQESTNKSIVSIQRESEEEEEESESETPEGLVVKTQRGCNDMVSIISGWFNPPKKNKRRRNDSEGDSVVSSRRNRNKDDIKHSKSNKTRRRDQDERSVCSKKSKASKYSSKGKKHK